MRKHSALIIVLLIILSACSPDLDYKVTGYTQKIIVEGRIETGRSPVVYLSLNVPLSKTVDSTTILDHVIRYAKVTVSDGEKTEILTSKWDKDYFPPYVYKGTEIVGEEGKNYTLKVEYGGYTLHAQTSIPQGFEIGQINSTNTDVDSLRTLSVNINVDNSRKNSFRVFTKKAKDKRFIETPVLFNSGLNLSGLQTFHISPQVAKTDSSYREGRFFVVGDTVDVRIRAIDSTSTMFFKDMTMFSVVAGNVFINEVKPLNSNISEPGFGIWYGCAMRTIRYLVP